MNEFVLKQIIEQNAQIDELFERFNSAKEDIDLNCVNILKGLRTFVEIACGYYYGKVNNIEFRISKDTLRIAVSFIKLESTKLKFIAKLHKYLQVSTSHYVIDRNSAPRLLSRYLPFLIKIRTWTKNEFNIQVLKNLNAFNKSHFLSISEYYKFIKEKIFETKTTNIIESKERYYVFKSSPIFIGEDVIYETTIGIASNYASKFNRFIVFSRFEIDEKYAIKINIVDSFVIVNNNKIPIKIATGFKYSIRPCEFTNFASLLGETIKVQSNNNEYNRLMNYMTDNNLGLHEIVLSSDIQFINIKSFVLEKTENPIIWPILEKTRFVIRHKKFGFNVLKYLLVNMNNVVIKNQYFFEPNLHGLYIKNQPFDSLPVAMSLINHNTSIFSLMEIYNFDDYEDELFYRRIRNRTNEEGILYHSCDELNTNKENADILLKKINRKLYWSPSSQIGCVGNNYYIESYENTSKSIIDMLKKLSLLKIDNYETYVQNVLNNNDYTIDSEEKKQIVFRLFSNSKVACIYGPAGTGKSTIAKHISFIFSNNSKLYISNTHPAVMNMYRKIGGKKEDFMTVSKYLALKKRCDILFIDECSMVSNDDMIKILENNLFDCLVLLGDVSQIQAIDYGPWFKLAKIFLNKNCKFELTSLHRTSTPELIEFWKAVRERQDYINELVSQNLYSRELDDNQLFEYNDNQIILALNYDGLYGVNNLNLILQEKNTCEEFKIGSYKYKIGDPVLFTENNAYIQVLYNNLKGRITNFKISEGYVEVFLTVDATIDSINISHFENLNLIKINPDNTSDISIKIDQLFDSDEDEKYSKLVPFQLAYAVTIHKAQGLEYEYVKVVISEELGEKITHDIFYTAITRATKNLEIFRTKTTQTNVINRICEKRSGKDISIFSNKFNFKIREKF